MQLISIHSDCVAMFSLVDVSYIPTLLFMYPKIFVIMYKKTHMKGGFLLHFVFLTLVNKLKKQYCVLKKRYVEKDSYIKHGIVAKARNITINKLHC